MPREHCFEIPHQEIPAALRRALTPIANRPDHELAQLDAELSRELELEHPARIARRVRAYARRILGGGR